VAESPVQGQGQTDPPWVADGVRAALAELRFFAQTLLAYVKSPRRFGAEWGAGTLRALNPAAFALNAVSFNGVWHILVVKAMSVELKAEPPLWAQALKATLPFVFGALFSILGHAAVRLAGSRRPYRNSLALSLFTSGPMLLFGAPLVPILAQTYRDPKTLASGLMVAAAAPAMMGLYIGFTASAMSGLHGVKKRWPATGYFLGFAFNAVVFSFLQRWNPEAMRWFSI